MSDFKTQFLFIFRRYVSIGYDIRTANYLAYRDMSIKVHKK